ncbi:hypothetical protein [Nocardia sp. NPDC052566]|uniref:hypothetical protein n=1 Tax=Nocardia sp. NPDC052566 TaxID=3364330 RepID=UPI0037C57B90
MKAGFVIEEHVVVYCDGCGDHYSEKDNESICFHSIAQAIAYFSAHSATVGWVYDGDRILCDGCIATLHCLQYGHTYPDTWQTTVWPLGKLTRSRSCAECGIPEIEAQS